MRTNPPDTFATLLAGARRGDGAAVGDLFALVYDQLREAARGQRRRVAAETLNTTALVHEAFLKLRGAERLDVLDEDHFMAVAARVQ